MQPFDFGRFDPFLEMRRLQSEMNRLLSGAGPAGAQQFPPINVWLGENSVVVLCQEDAKASCCARDGGRPSGAVL
jgi:hypothetical protein